MTLARLLAARPQGPRGTWGYRHTQALMSDTHMVRLVQRHGLACQCTRGRAALHRAEDLLPFMGLWPAWRRVSNQEMRFHVPTKHQDAVAHARSSGRPERT